MEKLFAAVINRARHMKIQRKILTVFFVFLFFSNALVMCVALRLYTNSIKQSTQQHFANSLMLISNYTDSYFSELRSAAYIFAYNSIVQNVLYASNDTEFEQFQKEKYIKGLLKGIDFTKPGVSSYFVADKNGRVYTNFAEKFNTRYDYRQEEWYRRLSGQPQMEWVMVDNPQLYLNDNNRYDSYCQVYKIRDGGKDDGVGYVVLEIEKSQIDALFQNEYVYPEHILVADGTGGTIYRNQPGNAVQQALLDSIPDDSDTGTLETTIDGHEYIAVYNKSREIGWTFVYSSSYDSLLTGLPAFLATSVLIFLLVIIITLLAAAYFSRMITRPIEALEQGIESVKHRNFAFRLPVMAYDEVGTLTENFNLMVDRIDYLVNKSKDAELLLKQIELEGLQQQVNPHFLYNTLEMIMGLSSENDTLMVNLICESLGGMFRYNLQSREIVTVEEEIRHVRNYAAIVETRFQGKFRVIFDIAPNTLRMGIMKFIIQPFVENAVTHGFDNLLEDGGVIAVRIRHDGDRIRIHVEDNGCGISDGALIEIRRQMLDTNGSQARRPTPHIGVLNVFFRLRLYFGDNFGFDIFRREQGTAIWIDVPPCDPEG